MTEESEVGKGWSVGMESLPCNFYNTFLGDIEI